VNYNQNNSSNNNQYKSNEYKECAGKNCKNPAKYKLIVKFIRMVGWFCKDCKKNLQEMDLIDVEEVIQK
jgi:hypothetical protein